MVNQLEWAADHPSDPLPPAPPNPDKLGLPVIPTAVDLYNPPGFCASPAGPPSPES